MSAALAITWERSSRRATEQSAREVLHHVSFSRGQNFGLEQSLGVVKK